jgi:hypothetical protein
MKRRLTTLLLGLGLLGASLVVASPAVASASTTSGASAAGSAPANCDFRQRHTFEPNTVFNAGDCYQTPASFLIMQDDGNFVLYNSAGRPRWSSDTWHFPGAYAIFQGDGNLVVYYEGFPLWDSRTAGNPGSHLILRGGDGSLLIRNAAGDLIWIV